MTDYVSEFDDLSKDHPETKSDKDYSAEFDSLSGGPSASQDVLDKYRYHPERDISDSSLENFTAAAGKATVDMYRRIRQLNDKGILWSEETVPGYKTANTWLRDKLGIRSAAELAAEHQADVEDSRQRDKALMSTKAGIAGNLVGQLATQYAGGRLIGWAIPGLAPATNAIINPQTYAQAALSGGVQGALQPTVGDESSAINTGLGALFGMGGQAVARGIGRLAQPVASVLSSAQQKAVNVLEKAGITLDAAQRTGSTFLNKLRSGFTDNPITAGAELEKRAGQMAQFNRAALEHIGEKADAATSDVMGRAADRINGVFRNILDNNDIAINNNHLNRMMQVMTEAESVMGKTGGENPITNQLSRIVNGVNNKGMIPGQEAYAVKKSLDLMEKSQDSTLKHYAVSLKEALMDAVDDSLSANDRNLFSKARLQFSNMKQIENAIDKEGTGNISPSRLANVLAQKANRFKSIYGRGDQELVELAQAGNMLLPDKHPNSGTTARLMMQIGLPMLAGTGQGIYASHTGDDMETAIGKGLLAAGSMAALPKTAQFLINSPRASNYLVQGVQSAPLRNILMAPQTQPAIGALVNRLGAKAAAVPIRALLPMNEGAPEQQDQPEQ